MRAWFQVAVTGVALVLGTGLGLPGRLWARPGFVTPPPIAAERDALIEKIARGQDYEASVARFIALEREIAAGKQAEVAQQEAVRAAEQKQREQKQREQQELVALRKTVDYLVAEHCLLSADPGKPADYRSSALLRADWGKVVRKEQILIKGKTAFDPDEPIAVYLVQGIERTYSLSSKSPTLYLEKGLSAAVGDLVLLCWTGLSTHGSAGYLPDGFRDHVISQGFATRIAAPPRIVTKKRWDPIHLTGQWVLRRAIERVSWDLPEGRPVLNYIHVRADLGQGRFEVAAERQSYILEVPGGLKNRELVQPGAYLWAIMSTPRFDKELRKLVLRAEDLEAKYIQALD